MKHQAYFTRALKARDPRYARIFAKLGYSTADMVADDGPAEVVTPRAPSKSAPPVAPSVPAVPAPASDVPPAPAAAETTPAAVPTDIPTLRAEYERLTGKKPFMGWKPEQLASKVAELRKA